MKDDLPSSAARRTGPLLGAGHARKLPLSRRPRRSWMRLRGPGEVLVRDTAVLVYQVDICDRFDLPWCRYVGS